jgi:hypothetical protein
MCKLISQLCKKSKMGYCCDLIAMMKNECGKDHFCSEIFIQDDESYKIPTIENNGNLYKFKVSKII